jgi:Na+/H+ antiporter NhaD/arsenite permease-like protein
MDYALVTSLIVFTLTYGLILSGRIDKAVAALCGGMAMIILHVVGEEEAFAHVDLSVIFLLTGMMIISNYLAESGFFGYAAVKFAQLGQGRPLAVLTLLCGVTGLLSALIDNVTTVVLIAPVTFLIAQQLEVRPIPFLIFEVLAANIGGAATLIGDPPNILIGSAGGFSFNDFVIHTGPVAVFCLALLVIVAVLYMGPRSRVSSDIRARVMEMKASRAIRDKTLLKKSGGVLIAVLLLFILHDLIHVGPAPIALAGAAILILITKSDPTDAFKAVEWPMLFFFVGLFVTVSGLAAAGVIDHAARTTLSLTGSSLTLASMVVLWFAGLTSAVVGAVPMVTALIPVLKGVIPGLVETTGADAQSVHHAMWWSLSLGACFGANGTIFGAACNIVVVEIARKNEQPIGFLRFMVAGAPIALITMGIASIYVLLRYV